jgi:3-phenylpropionate/trans-cinnamate dioxygenase ferredoxin subunit
MSASAFHPVAKVSDLPEGGKTVVEIDDRLVALIHQGGQFFAIDDVCTHDGGPLAEGELEGYEIICPRHGARFDIRDGRALCLPATRPTVVHEVKVENGQVYVRLKEGI